MDILATKTGHETAVSAKPGDIVRLDSGRIMLVHSDRNTPRWPLVGWQVVASDERRHRQDVELGMVKQMHSTGTWKVRACEIIHGRAVAVLTHRGMATVNRVITHARKTLDAVAWEDARSGKPARDASAHER